ncbi:hypothetical protein M758_UG135500 [Ceratodon purpureus]|nr:hypothetical protein M758_UG135500 [Ceratodon purpureus]
MIATGLQFIVITCLKLISSPLQTHGCALVRPFSCYLSNFLYIRISLELMSREAFC